MKRLTIGTRACTEILALLVHVAWTDKKLSDPEKAGIRAAASVFNLGKDQRTRLEELLAAPQPFDKLLLDTLSPRDRAFAFVAAVWLTGVDDEVDPEEAKALEAIATRLGIDGPRKAELTALARDLEPAKKGEGSWADGLVALFKAIPARLEAQPEAELEIAFEED